MIGVISVIPAKKTSCKNQEKLTKNRDFYLKCLEKIHNFRVRGVIVTPLPRRFRVRGVIAVIPAKMTFFRIDYFRYQKKILSNNELFLQKIFRSERCYSQPCFWCYNQPPCKRSYPISYRRFGHGFLCMTRETFIKSRYPQVVHVYIIKVEKCSNFQISNETMPSAVRYSRMAAA